MEIWPGKAYPLGATYDGTGVNFAIFSEVAEKVELCLIGNRGAETRVELPEVDGFVWHGYVPGIQPGQRYGFRVHGPYAPSEGHRCDASKLLLDPYAKAIDGQMSFHPSLFSYRMNDPNAGLSDRPSTKDSRGRTLLSVVTNPFFDWGLDRSPGHEYHESVIYEAHVKGMTKLHPDVPEEIRGTYAGIAHPVTIEHLTSLGVTAIELMPVHQYVQDFTLLDKGLSNYWGYNTIGYFAPHNGYAAYGTRGEQVLEFKGMVKALHEAGIEVILDVVYNHTAEGNHLGPTLAFRGIDNNAYYRLVSDDKRHYYDTTGTGNSLLMRSPHVLQLIMDSLRYWVLDMHVDGFRFDLAATLARQFHEVDRLSAFFDLVQQDPVVSQVKLIAEPWDVGDGGYQVGNFPPLWTEWNGKYRDTVRDFWRGEFATLGEFASRFSGSSDLYEHSGRKPIASINFVTAHDGFPLADLVSYNEKHNQANGEDNRDGESHNRSWNCGAEGPTDNTGRARAPSSAAAQPADDAAPVAGRPDGLPRGRAGPVPGWQQQRLLSGQRGLMGGLGPVRGRRGPVGLHPSARRDAARAPRLPSTPVLRRQRGPRRREPGPGHRVVQPHRRAHGRGGLVQRVRAFAHGVPQRPGHPRARPARPPHRRRPFPRHLQRSPRDPAVQPARRVLRCDVGHRDRHRRDGRRQRAEGWRYPRRRGTQRHRPQGPARGTASTTDRSRVDSRGVTRMPHRPGRGRPIPASTYRLQIQPAFTFVDAAEEVGRLARLGVSHLYLSPILQPVPGSTHGYDVVDHSRVNEDAGGISGLRALAERAHEDGLGIVADVVPNHMATPTPAHLNAQWWSFLREGRDSPFAHWFDVDWAAQDGRVLVPVLGDRLPALLDRGELAVARDGGASGRETVVRYHEHEFPVRPGTEDLALPDLLDGQCYRLEHWVRGGDELNYRRFFDVTSLIAVRVEDEDVFQRTHDVLIGLVREGTLDGLRIDHPDGLADPAGYFARLDEATGGAWVVAEKILEGEETLPDDWRCAGTTGYDTLLRVGGVFVDGEGEDALTLEWRKVSADPRPLGQVVTESKAGVVRDVLGAEVSRLLRALEVLCPGIDPPSLQRALVTLLSSMGRYRAYVRPAVRAPAEAWHVVGDAAARAGKRLGDDPAARVALEAVVGLVLGVRPPGTTAAGNPDLHADLVVRFQQTCGPVMAKGLEDTAFYRYLRLSGLNEVGGDPSRVGIPPEELHRFAGDLLATWPATMTTLSTHDTKRSEDVRARLAVIAERADAWRAWVDRARDLARGARPDRLDGATEYLVWQTLVGTWPITADRLTGYLEKAVREAKVHTGWTAPDTAYEEAVLTFARDVLADERLRRHVENWVRETAAAARSVVLGQKLLQLVVPGVPDVYQGSEVVDLSLVDPDNRRAVDHVEISRRLDHLDAGRKPTDLSDEKLLVTATTLRLRREHPDWFTGPDAIYRPVETDSRHAVALSRGPGEPDVVAVVTRFRHRLAETGGWQDATVELPAGQWRDLLGGHRGTGRLRLHDLLTELPVALLVRNDR